jgi:hypothetical protein
LGILVQGNLINVTTILFRLNKIVEAIDVKFDESSFVKSKSKQKNHQIYEIDDKHKMNDEVSETEETKAADSEQLILTLT